MATTGPSNQVQKARQVSKNILSLNNSAVSATTDRLASVLEGGQATPYVRNHFDDLAAQIAATEAVDFEWFEFRKLSSIKDKIAYLVGSKYGHQVGNWGWVGGVNNINDITWHAAMDTEVRKQLNTIIGTIETKLLNHQDFSESRIVRHAAVNRFEMKLTASESAELGKLASALHKITADGGYDILAEAMHFQKESDIQKLLKISETVAMLTNEGVAIDAKTIEQFDKMAEKIKPLKDLDKHYKHLTNTLNMVHRVAKKGYPSMIPMNSQKKLFTVLQDLGVEDMNTYILDAAKTNESGERSYLDNELLTLRNKNVVKFREVLKKNLVTEGEFETWFMSYFSYMTVEKAKKDFDKQKSLTFSAGRLKDFEQDVNTWRGHARARVLEIHGRMRHDPLDFGTPDDFDMASSYFDKFKDLFYASEEDADTYQHMRDIVAAIIRQRVPVLVNDNRRRFAPALRKVVARINNPRLTTFVNRLYRDADDAQILAMIIMAQNESSSMMFYQDSDPFAEKRTRMKRFSQTVSRAESGREAVRDAISPTANKLFRFGEGALKGATKLAFGAVKPLNKIISGTGKAASRTGKSLLGAMNRGIEGRKYNTTKEHDFKRWKLPLYAIYPATLLAEKGLTLTDKGFKYTLQNGSKHIESAKKVTADGYHGMVNRVKEGTGDQEVKYMYQGFTHAFEGVAKFLGKTTSWIGQNKYDSIHTSQQRNVLSSFFQAASHEENLAELMESSDLANMLNLKERWPYLFDEDGRSMSIDKAKKKEYKEDADGAKEYAKDNGKQIMEDMNASFKEYAERIEKAYLQQEDKFLAMSPTDSGYDAMRKELATISTHQRVLAAKEQDIVEMIGLLHSFLEGTKTSDDFYTETETSYKKFKDSKDANDTAITDAKTEIAAQEGIKKTKTKELEDIKNRLARVAPGDKSYADLLTERNDKETIKNTNRTALRTLETQMRANRGEKEKLELQRNFQAEALKDIKKKADRKLEYDDAVDRWEQLQDELNQKKAALAKITDKKSPEKTKLLNELRDLEQHEKKLNNMIYGGSVVDNNITNDNVTDAQAALQKTEDEITDNKTAYEDIVSQKNNAQDDYETAVADLAKIDAKLAQKMTGDKGYADLIADRDAAEGALETADQTIAAQHKIIEQAAQEAKMHADMYRWATKMYGFASKIKKNSDDYLTADPKVYMKEVQRLLKEFNGYMTSKKSVAAGADKRETLKTLFNITDETKLDLMMDLLNK